MQRRGVGDHRGSAACDLAAELHAVAVAGDADVHGRCVGAVDVCVVPLAVLEGLVLPLVGQPLARSLHGKAGRGADGSGEIGRLGGDRGPCCLRVQGRRVGGHGFAAAVRYLAAELHAVAGGGNADTHGRRVITVRLRVIPPAVLQGLVLPLIGQPLARSLHGEAGRGADGPGEIGGLGGDIEGSVRNPGQRSAVVLAHVFGPGGVSCGIVYRGLNTYEGATANAGRVSTEGDITQCAAFPKGAIPDLSQRGRKFDLLQCVAVSEGSGSDLCHAAGDRDVGQGGTVIEHVVRDFLHSAADCHGCKIAAAMKGTAAQACHIAGNRHIGQAGGRKGTGTNGGYTLADGQRGQSRTPIERIFTDGSHLGGNRHTHQILALLKRVGADGSQRGGQSELAHPAERKSTVGDCRRSGTDVQRVNIAAIEAVLLIGLDVAGNGQSGNGGLAEGIIAYLGDRRGNCQACELAACQRTLSDCRHAAGDAVGGCGLSDGICNQKRLALVEQHVANATVVSVCAVHRNSGQCGAGRKGVSANTGHAGGNGNALQRSAALESTVADGGQAGGKRYRRQARAFRQREVADLRHAGGERYLGDGRTVSEGPRVEKAHGDVLPRAVVAHLGRKRYLPTGAVIANNMSFPVNDCIIQITIGVYSGVDKISFRGGRHRDQIVAARAGGVGGHHCGRDHEEHHDQGQKETVEALFCAHFSTSFLCMLLVRGYRLPLFTAYHCFCISA